MCCIQFFFFFTNSLSFQFCTKFLVSVLLFVHTSQLECFLLTNDVQYGYVGKCVFYFFILLGNVNNLVTSAASDVRLLQAVGAVRTWQQIEFNLLFWFSKLCIYHFCWMVTFFLLLSLQYVLFFSLRQAFMFNGKESCITCCEYIVEAQIMPWKICEYEKH